MRPGGRGYPVQPREFAKQLAMVRTERGFAEAVDVPAGYRLRQFEPGDEERYAALFGLAFERADPLMDILPTRLEGGFFVVEHVVSGALTASCVAQHHPRPRNPEGGELGWLVTDPKHAGKGLGTAVAASVTNALAAAGYERPFLLTDDFRLPAISIYLKLGWRPSLDAEGMEERWRAVYGKLGREFVVGEGRA